MHTHSLLVIPMMAIKPARFVYHASPLNARLIHLYNSIIESIGMLEFLRFVSFFFSFIYQSAMNFVFFFVATVSTIYFVAATVYRAKLIMQIQIALAFWTA